MYGWAVIVGNPSFSSSSLRHSRKAARATGIFSELDHQMNEYVMVKEKHIECRRSLSAPHIRNARKPDWKQQCSRSPAIMSKDQFPAGEATQTQQTRPHTQQQEKAILCVVKMAAR